MMTTINVSLPISLYSKTKDYAKNYSFASVSEVIRQALRKMIGIEELTENGFTKKAEQGILSAAKDKPIMAYRKGEDYDAFMDKLLRKGAELNAKKD